MTDIISPYRVPVFNAMAAEEGISLFVLVLCRNMKGRNWLFPESKILFNYGILNNIQIGLLDRPSFVLNFRVIENHKIIYMPEE